MEACQMASKSPIDSVSFMSLCFHVVSFVAGLHAGAESS